MQLNRTFERKVVSIWISWELPLFNFEHLDISWAWIRPLGEKLWPWVYDWDPWYTEMLKIQTLVQFKNSKSPNFWHGFTIEAHDISRCSKLKNGSSREIQMAISFHSEVRFSDVIYRVARNWMLNLWANSNDNNFLLGCLTESRNISRRSKLNVKALSQFKRQ